MVLLHDIKKALPGAFFVLYPFRAVINGSGYSMLSPFIIRFHMNAQRSC
jgi:hypothetical protein